MKSSNWDDHYTRRARKEKWLARSVYKLEEIDKRFKLIRRGNRILDLGCYPGSWAQYALRKAGPKGDVVGIDLTTPDGILGSNFRFIQGDVLDIDLQWLAGEIASRDVVLSDLAPKTTGNRITDTSRSMNLAGRAAEIAQAILHKNGRFVCKIFENEELKAFEVALSKSFGNMKRYRPKATRKRSSEVYLMGLDFIR
jgi:23S rRNA (uridine2552-2'-O)-methyltransferase